jgi:outer membrane protein assembly factor BamB
MNRRRFLGALGVTVGGVGGLSTRTHVGPLSTWTPDSGTWPLRRYDLKNSARNPSASPPANPSVEWQTDPIGNVSALVADRTRAYVGIHHKSKDQVLALDRTTGNIRWSKTVPGRELAVHDNRLYVASYEQAWALDTKTGETRWSTSLPELLEPALLVTDDQLFVAGRMRVVAFDVATGNQQWEFSGENGVIADGALLTWSDAGELARLDARRVSDRVTGAPPPVAWDVYLDRSSVPVVHDGRVLVGTDYHMDEYGLTAVALDSGDVEWATEPDADDGHAEIGPPAVASGRGFVDRNYHESGTMNYQDVVAVSLTDGTLDWEQSIESEILSTIVGGKTVLVATGVLDRGPPETRSGGVHAYSLTGEKQWQFDLDKPVYRLITVEDTIYLATSDFNRSDTGRVYALS